MYPNDSGNLPPQKHFKPPILEILCKRTWKLMCGSWRVVIVVASNMCPKQEHVRNLGPFFAAVAASPAQRPRVECQTSLVWQGVNSAHDLLQKIFTILFVPGRLCFVSTKTRSFWVAQGVMGGGGLVPCSCPILGDTQALASPWAASTTKGGFFSLERDKCIKCI